MTPHTRSVINEQAMGIDRDAREMAEPTAPTPLPEGANANQVSAFDVATKQYAADLDAYEQNLMVRNPGVMSEKERTALARAISRVSRNS